MPLIESFTKLRLKRVKISICNVTPLVKLADEEPICNITQPVKLAIALLLQLMFDEVGKTHQSYST